LYCQGFSAFFHGFSAFFHGFSKDFPKVHIPAFLYDNFRNILRKKNFSLNFAKKHSQVLFYHGIITQIFLSEEKRKISARASGIRKPTR